MKSEDKRIVRRVHGAGRWFPGDEKDLSRMINTFIESAKVPEIRGRIVAGIAPHAGYVFSGKTAGYTFRALKDAAASGNAPETVVVLGLSHRGGFSGIALMDGDALATPLGEVALDNEAADLLVKGRDRIRRDYAPHAGEHSAENEIPFVQAALPKAKLVVAMFGDHEKTTLDQLVAGLNELAAKKKIFVIASTDLLHDPDYDLVSTTDRITLKKIAALEVKDVASSWSPGRQVCCGLMPVLTAMQFARDQGSKAGQVLYYRNNGDDDPSSRGNWVVGYGSVIFTVE
ncbi:MAG: AmmeMemoRadiSam system protein B [Lentisphaerales bacterium]|jgi:AmmeMemoRadiSam system protein B|nr:MAG: AmmeMemoRadiSam system protein B [Lentisphaerales bacterium]